MIVMVVVAVLLVLASVKGYRGKFGFARSSSRTWAVKPEPGKSSGGGVFSFLKSEGPDFFIDEEPKKPSAVVKAAVTAPKTVVKAPAPLVGQQAPNKIKASFVPAKVVTTAKPATVISSASKPPPINKPTTLIKSAPAPPAIKRAPTGQPALVSKPLSTVKMPEAKPLIAAKPSSTPGASSSSKASIKPKPASGGSSDRLLNVEALPDFLQSTLAPAVDAVNDIVELPATIERKTQETIKSIENSVDRTVNTVKFVASIPSKIAESTANTVNFVKGVKSNSTEVPVPSAKVNYVANPEVVKSKEQQSKPSAAITFEDVKEGIYRVGDVIEGTANLIQATGKGAVSAVQAAQRLPSDLERLSKSTTAKVEETKASIDAAVSGAEEVAASVTAFGESIVKLPQTVENKVVETQKSVERLKAKIAYVQDRLQGKPLPPPPPPPQSRPAICSAQLRPPLQWAGQECGESKKA